VRAGNRHETRRASFADTPLMPCERQMSPQPAGEPLVEPPTAVARTDKVVSRRAPPAWNFLG